MKIDYFYPKHLNLIERHKLRKITFILEVYNEVTLVIRNYNNIWQCKVMESSGFRIYFGNNS